MMAYSQSLTLKDLWMNDDINEEHDLSQAQSEDRSNRLTHNTDKPIADMNSHSQTPTKQTGDRPHTLYDGIQVLTKSKRSTEGGGCDKSKRQKLHVNFSVSIEDRKSIEAKNNNLQSRNNFQAPKLYTLGSISSLSHTRLTPEITIPTKSYCSPTETVKSMLNKKRNAFSTKFQEEKLRICDKSSLCEAASNIIEKRVPSSKTSKDIEPLKAGEQATDGKQKGSQRKQKMAPSERVRLLRKRSAPPPKPLLAVLPILPTVIPVVPMAKGKNGEPLKPFRRILPKPTPPTKEMLEKMTKVIDFQAAINSHFTEPNPHTVVQPTANRESRGGRRKNNPTSTISSRDRWRFEEEEEEGVPKEVEGEAREAAEDVMRVRHEDYKDRDIDVDDEDLTEEEEEGGGFFEDEDDDGFIEEDEDGDGFMEEDEDSDGFMEENLDGDEDEHSEQFDQEMDDYVHNYVKEMMTMKMQLDGKDSVKIKEEPHSDDNDEENGPYTNEAQQSNFFIKGNMNDCELDMERSEGQRGHSQFEQNFMDVKIKQENIDEEEEEWQGPPGTGDKGEVEEEEDRLHIAINEAASHNFENRESFVVGGKEVEAVVKKKCLDYVEDVDRRLRESIMETQGKFEEQQKDNELVSNRLIRLLLKEKRSESVQLPAVDISPGMSHGEYAKSITVTIEGKFREILPKAQLPSNGISESTKNVPDKGYEKEYFNDLRVGKTLENRKRKKTEKRSDKEDEIIEMIVKEECSEGEENVMEMEEKRKESQSVEKQQFVLGKEIQYFYDHFEEEMKKVIATNTEKGVDVKKAEEGRKMDIEQGEEQKEDMMEYHEMERGHHNVKFEERTGHYVQKAVEEKKEEGNHPVLNGQFVLNKEIQDFYDHYEEQMMNLTASEKREGDVTKEQERKQMKVQVKQEEEEMNGKHFSLNGQFDLDAEIGYFYDHYDEEVMKLRAREDGAHLRVRLRKIAMNTLEKELRKMKKKRKKEEGKKVPFCTVSDVKVEELTGQEVSQGWFAGFD